MTLLLDIFGYLSVLLRGLVLTAQTLTFGSLTFLFLLLRPLSPYLGAKTAAIETDCQIVLRFSAFAFAFFVLCSLFLNAAVIVGTVDVSWDDALQAGFAHADLTAALCALIVGLICKGEWTVSRQVALLVLAAVALLAQLTITHAASRLELRWPFLTADAMHMIGAGMWIGGLPCFLIALRRCDNGNDWRIIGRRYSLMSMASVAAIFLGGIVMSIGFIGSLEAFYGTAYGIMTLTKVILFLLLLMLGAANFRTVDALRHDKNTPILRLKRFAEVEIGIGKPSYSRLLPLRPCRLAST